MKHSFLRLGAGIAALGLFFALGAEIGRAATLRVRQDGAGNYATIQSAVNAMAPGDTVVVGPGLYNERITFPTGKSGSPGRLTTIKAETQRTVDTQGFDTRNCDYLRIEGFNITRPAGTTGYPNGVGVALRSSHVQVVSNYLHDITWVGMYGYKGDYVSNNIAGNRMYKVGTGIIIYGSGWIVEANEIERLVYHSSLGDADYCLYFGYNHIIRSNWWHGTLPTEIGPSHVDGFQTYDQVGWPAQHIRIEGNRVDGFYHQGCMMEAPTYTNSYDIVICNNIFRQATTWGVCVTRNIRDVKIYNNLFIDINSYGVGIRAGASGEVRNNIFYNVSYWDTQTSPASGSRNLWYRPGATLAGRFNGDLVNVNPRFVDVAGTDFHLAAGSPAIDAGLGLTGVLADRDGVSRPQGAGWDIGPYEYVSTIAPARLLSPRKLGNDMVFTFVADAGSTYRIESSADLAQWTPVKTVTLTSGSLQVTNASSGQRLFYRAVLVP
ncbi:MAG TPA: choice-of-anchor Q domain-containing protein [Clostridia bacterium]|nr:choice-of-anchor Q domain-containing protein [Clostridia bacterium]